MLKKDTRTSRHKAFLVKTVSWPQRREATSHRVAGPPFHFVNIKYIESSHKFKYDVYTARPLDLVNIAQGRHVCYKYISFSFILYLDCTENKNEKLYIYIYICMCIYIYIYIFENIMGSFWGHFGVFLESFWHHF